jgi:p-aminobenzoyl-glutamate transporter AbgT
MGILKFGLSMVLAEKPVSDYINTNTLFIAVVVLAIIILIMIINYFANIKPRLNSSTAKPSHNSSVDNVLAQIAQNEEEELVNDCELVAVITAAIMASLGDAAPADGFVVRSIKRANGKRWMNA